MSNTQKIDNTFSRAATELARLEKAFAENSKLDTAVLEARRDTSVLAIVREGISTALEALTTTTLTEGVLDGDDEDGFMARSQLYFLAQDSIKLHGAIDDRDNLEPWVQSKIAQASKDIQAVSRYIEYNNTQEPHVNAVEEGYTELPPMNPKYVERKGLEGPFPTKSGKVVYYDPKEGSYYDPDTDIYLTHDEWKQLDEDTNGCADCEWIKDETDGEIDTCDECAAVNEAMDSASPELVAIFDDLQRGDKVKIKHDSALEKGTDYIEYVVRSNNVLRNGVGKATLARADSPTSVKRVLYKRNGKVTMAIGDMAATLVDIQKVMGEAYSPIKEAGGYYTQPVYDMIEKYGHEKVMHELLTSLDADVIQSFLQRADLDEGKSPHKKGTKKYNKHMAAMHAEEVEEGMNFDDKQDSDLKTIASDMFSNAKKAAKSKAKR